MERKVGEIEADYHKKEEENFERMEQLSLELTQARSRIDENDKMLEEAITCQIMSE